MEKRAVVNPANRGRDFGGMIWQAIGSLSVIVAALSANIEAVRGNLEMIGLSPAVVSAILGVIGLLSLVYAGATRPKQEA